MPRDFLKKHRFDKLHSATARSWAEISEQEAETLPENAWVDCGWGRLLFAHTFRSPEALVKALGAEEEGRRDIALYVRDPHVVVALAPQELFLDPSDTYRLWLAQYRPLGQRSRGFTVRRLRTRADAAALSRVCARCGMVPPDPAFVWKNRTSRRLIYLVAEDTASGRIVGSVTGVDHTRVFADPENGSSLWCLAVDPQAPHPGLGQALINHLAQYFHVRGRAFMDLSVLHDNHQAIALYRKLGFQRIPAFCIKHKNPINEPLFTGPVPGEDLLNPYALIIIREARRRGIGVEVLDAEEGYFALTMGGRRIVCRESLSELTTAIAMSRCADKGVTSRLLARAGLRVPRQQAAGSAAANREFLDRHGALVVKPAQGEQGHNVFVRLESPAEVEKAVAACGRDGDRVLLEEFCPGEDLRVIVINYKMVAAALRRPAMVVGTGEHTISQLIAKQSRRRAAATGGESRIPLDEETRRCVQAAGYTLEQAPPAGEEIRVRNTANLHTGGTIHDVTEQLHPELVKVAEEAARVLAIPVVGLDLMVTAVNRPDYVIIEANERPGLANHEPQPTAERFVDFLFPQTV
ncbi:N-acetylglutaminylglutamine synthetase [Desulfurivibrio sp. C05AmB]|uniref:N-acetylglutaminylglutamine synthetase n=1 Tax=Desulfurivibrio sp. C05AmB TaxID=3374371 RepID=UPI00376EA9A8